MSFTASTDALEIRHTASLPETRATTQLHKSRSLPTIHTPDTGLSIRASAIQGQGQNTPPSTFAKGTRPDIPLLGPIPERFSPEESKSAYDYLGVVKSLADEIAPGLYDSLFEQHFQQGHRSVDLFTTGLWRPHLLESWEEGNFHILQRLRQYWIINTREQSPCVLVVEAIDKAGVQALGMALNIDPCFFASHLQESSPLDAEIPNNKKVRSLSASFAKYVTSRDEKNTFNDHIWRTGNDDNRFSAMDAVYLGWIKYCNLDDGYAWPLAGTYRIRDLVDKDTGSRCRLSACVSCCRVSQNGCKDLIVSSLLE